MRLGVACTHQNHAVSRLYMLLVNVNINIPQHYSPAHQSQNKKRPITTTKHQPREISADYGQIYNLDNQCTYERKKKKNVQTCH